MPTKSNKNRKDFEHVSVDPMVFGKSLLEYIKAKCFSVFTNIKNKFMSNPMLYLFIFTLFISILKGVFSNDYNNPT